MLLYRETFLMIRAIVDCEFLLDGGAMNGIVPRALWKWRKHSARKLRNGIWIAR